MKLFLAVVLLCLQADGLLGGNCFFDVDCTDALPHCLNGVCKESADYFIGPEDSLCKDGMYLDLSECLTAAEQLDIEFKGDEEEDNYPGGCYIHILNMVYFNYEQGRSHAAAKPICGQDDHPPVTEEPEPEPCVWGAWHGSSCSVTCGDGEQVFTRELTSGDKNNCKGCNTRVDSCTIEEKCPVDCQWSEWSPSECTASCGGGTLTKERTSQLSKEKLAETPSCMHKLVLVESCNTDECPVNCEWGRWQDQRCDCATGLMTRTRQKTKEKAFGGRECDGKPSGTIACNYLECKIPYAIGQKGEICDEDKKIMDGSDCYKFASSIYFEYDWQENSFSSEDAPNGCVVNDENKEAFFNTHETGSEEGTETDFSPVCKQDPKLCPDECKTMCVSPPRKTPGRRNKHRNGYCYNWCANVDNPNLHTNNGKYGFCGVSGAIKENSIDCRGCWKAFHV